MVADARSHLSLDPFALQELLWPDAYAYSKERDIIESVWSSLWTLVQAGNKLGKDWTAALICLLFFLTRHPCRIVTTSAKEQHLKVLWGEIGNFIQQSAHPLDSKLGGPLLVNHLHIRKVVGGEVCPLSYLTGMVAGDDSIAALQGHHIADTFGDGVPRTMFVCDEASSAKNAYFKMAKGWAKRFLIFGNPWECQNEWRQGLEAGDLWSTDGRRMLRRCIHISAEDSPNVRLARAQIAAGKEPTGEVLVPGVKTWEEYQDDLQTWDEVQKCVGLFGDFYKGAQLLLFPHDWLDRAHRLAETRSVSHSARAVGVDPAEGGDSTSMCAVDEWGIAELVSLKTPDTAVIPDLVLAFAHKHGVLDDRIVFDAGGGGKQIVDMMRMHGHREVTTIAFGEAIVPMPQRRRAVYTPYVQKLDQREERYAYLNRRAEMYWGLSALLDPSRNPGGFAIPRASAGPQYVRLRKQLGVIPKVYDKEGRERLPPKNRTSGTKDGKGERTLVELIGHSPDEADALVLAVYRMLNAATKPVTAGAVA